MIAKAACHCWASVTGPSASMRGTDMGQSPARQAIYRGTRSGQNVSDGHAPTPRGTSKDTASGLAICHLLKMQANICSNT